MKSSIAANLSLLLAVVAWPLVAYGFASMMGDRFDVPAEVIRAQMRISSTVAYTGFFSLAASLWLSGYAFPVAKRRAVLAASGCVLPPLVMGIYSMVTA
jgi:hypothetical protein